MNSSSSRPGSGSRSQTGYTSRPSSNRSPGYSPYEPGPAPRRSSGGSPLFPFLLGNMIGRSQARSSRMYRASPPPVYEDPRYYDDGSPYRQNAPVPPRRSGGGTKIVLVLIGLILVFLIFISFMGCSPKSSQDHVGISTVNREKIDNPNAYNYNDIVDEVGWFDNTSQAAKELKSFYDKTGIQPYIVLKAYDPSLKTDAQKAEYARNYYEEYIPDEDTLLYMYFAEPNENAVGYQELVNGKEIGSVMDPEAVSIFWNYLDQEWTTDKSTDELFADTFNQTADRIMTRTTTSKDVWSKALIVLAVVAVGGVIIAVLMVRRKHEKERAEETERILSTPLNASKAEEEDLVSRYEDKNGGS